MKESVSYLAGEVSTVAAKYASIVVAVSILTATCLLKVRFEFVNANACCLVSF